MRRRAIAALAALVAGGTAAATLFLGDAAGGGDRSGREALRANVGHDATASFFRPYETLAEMLPNTLHGVPGEAEPVPVSSSVVVGEVIDVVSADGYIESAASARTGELGEPTPGKPTRTTFDSPLADWRTLRVVVRVDEVVAGSPVDKVEFDWSVLGSTARGEDAGAVATGLRELGTVLLFLTDGPADPSLADLRVADRVYGVATVGADGALDLPFLDSSDVAAFESGVSTIDELRVEAAQPVEVDKS